MPLEGPSAPGRATAPIAKIGTFSLHQLSSALALPARRQAADSPSHQHIHLLLQLLELVAHGDKRVLYLSRAVHARSVHVEHLARSRQLVAANLHKIIHHLDLLDVLRRVLPHSVARGLRLQVRKLRLPIPQQTLTDIQHLSHFLNGVVQFSRFFGLQGHDTSSKKSDTKDRSGAEKELFSAVAALFFCKSSENYVPLQNFLSISHR